jgi:hypothetical protein
VHPIVSSSRSDFCAAFAGAGLAVTGLAARAPAPEFVAVDAVVIDGEDLAGIAAIAASGSVSLAPLEGSTICFARLNESARVAEVICGCTGATESASPGPSAGGDGNPYVPWTTFC